MAIKFEIKESHGILSENQKGWTKELNSVSWNDRASKFDLREWDEDHKKMGKGMTLSLEEMQALKDIINNLDI